MTLGSEFLYHCFPRRSTPAQISAFGYSPTDEGSYGIEILQSIVDAGLLLTPETLTVPVNRRSIRKHPPGPLTITQRRACFTLLDREELFEKPFVSGERESERTSATSLSHVQSFGRFAIGLDPIEARALGVVPTFYYYNVRNQIAGLQYLLPRHARDQDFADFGPSSELLYRLAELRSLLVSIAYIEALGSPKGRAVYSVDRLREYGYRHSAEPDVDKALSYLTHRLANQMHSCLDTDRVPAWNMIEWIDIILNSFQIADSKTSLSSLEYYQQREWRLVQFYSPITYCYPLTLREQPDDGRFLNARGVQKAHYIVQRHSVEQGFKYDPDNIFVLAGACGRPLWSYIREIIFPKKHLGAIEDTVIAKISTHMTIKKTSFECDAEEFIAVETKLRDDAGAFREPFHQRNYG